MDTNIVVLILGLATILVIAVILLKGLIDGHKVKAGWKSTELFSANVEFEPKDTAGADLAAREAAKQRGAPPDVEPTEPVRPVGRIARVLWVDDHPDYNIYETVALERLGRFVTKTTTNDNALKYLSEELGFALVITDLGRDKEGPRAGVKLSEARP